jgi:hypothetical protein
MLKLSGEVGLALEARAKFAVFCITHCYMGKEYFDGDTPRGPGLLSQVNRSHPSLPNKL